MSLLPPALATRVDAVPLEPGWLHEPKFDGYRMQCHASGGRAVLLTRKGLDWSAKFPQVREAVLAVVGRRSVVLDGEIVAAAPRGASPFAALQAYLREGRTTGLTYWVFDLLAEGRTDLRALPLSERRARLATVLGALRPRAVVRRTMPLRGHADTLLAAACRKGEEGVISKRLDAPYRGGRGRDWLKIKCGQREEFVVVGWSEPEGARTHLGALLLATRATPRGPLRYAGRVGSGFATDVLRAVHARLQRVAIDAPAVRVPAAAARGVHWVEPVLVAEVAFAEWTPDQLLRQATFLGLREDKEGTDVRKESGGSTVAGVTITHPERVVYPGMTLTKLELAAYHEVVAPHMLRWIAKRPLSTLRCPDGALGSCFFQKHWPSARGGNVHTVALTESDASEEAYAVARNAADLVTLVQMNVIEFHTWASQVGSLEQPDRMVLDLDPGPGVGWVAIRDSALLLRDVLADAGLQSWVKLSGGKGVHVTLPVEKRLSWQQFSDVAHLIASRMVAEHPRLFVDTASKERRTKRIFIDWLRNSRGATAVAPWSVRARKGAPVAVPVAWDELAAMPKARIMNVREVQEHLAGAPIDPWRDMATCRQRVTAAVVAALGAEHATPARR